MSNGVQVRRALLRGGRRWPGGATAARTLQRLLSICMCWQPQMSVKSRFECIWYVGEEGVCFHA
jgi:hypothetical protein